MNPLKIIDDTLNKFTIYRVLIYGLSALVAIAFILSMSGRLTLSVKGLAISLILIIVTGYCAHKMLSVVWNASASNESWLITSLILFFILPPATTTVRIIAVVLASYIAVASKYIVVLNRKHIFNPAAFAAVAVGITGLMNATWWIGNSVMMPIVAVFGLLVVRKIRRGPLLIAYIVPALITIAVIAAMKDRSIVTALSSALTSSPLIFLGTIMLTEPSTMPPKVRQQMIYGGIVGLLAFSQLRIGNQYIVAESALVIGNIYAFAVSPRYKLSLKLRERTMLSPHIYDLAFTSDRDFSFVPGQYLELTMPHKHIDSRGNRRVFSIASSPSETELHIGIKTYDKSSSYKSELLALNPGDILSGGQLAGSFVLPKDRSTKLVLIAGGIGITPFRSMIRDMIDTSTTRDIVLFYIVSSPHDLVYLETINAAASFGVRVVTVLTSRDIPNTWKELTGRLTPEIIKSNVPDFSARKYFLSGPNGMVSDYRQMLLDMSVSRTNIHADYFSGY